MYNQAVNKAKEEGKLRGDNFSFQEGDNKLRLIGEAILHESEFKGKPTRKWMVYILDRKDGKVKLAFIPVSVMGQIADLQSSEDWGFTEAMPYDINIRAKNPGTLEVEYSVQPTMNRTPLSDSELDQITKSTPIKQIVERLQTKQSLPQSAAIDSRNDNVQFNPENYPEA